MHTVSLAMKEFMGSDEVRRRAPATRKKQALVLRLLLTREVGLTGSDPIARLGRSHIDAALNVARDRKVQESTLNTYRSDLRRFGGWLLSCRYVKTDPTAHLRNVRTSTPKSKRKPISGEQAHQVVSVAEQIHPRDGMTAMLMLTTGLRASEVVGLTWADIDLSAHSGVAYRPKQRDQHLLHLSRQLCLALEKWQRVYEERHGPIEPCWYIVPALAHRAEGGTPRHMSPDWPMTPTSRQSDPGQRVKVWLAAVGETDLVGRASHTMRRTAANLLHQSGVDTRTVQTFLGHRSVAMTELYLDIDAAQDKLRNTLQGFEI
jgi:integrase/recombinase XerC